jgi:hypothetical protein
LIFFLFRKTIAVGIGISFQYEQCPDPEKQALRKTVDATVEEFERENGEVVV